MDIDRIVKKAAEAAETLNAVWDEGSWSRCPSTIFVHSHDSLFKKKGTFCIVSYHSVLFIRISNPKNVFRVFLAVGFPASVRASHFVECSNQLEGVFLTLVENEKRVRDEYRTNVMGLQKLAEQLEATLRVTPTVGPKHASLMILFDFYSKRVEDLRQVRFYASN